MQNQNEPVNTKETDSPTDKKDSTMKEILSWIEVIVIAIVLALFLNNFVIVNATVPSGSMENTIQPGDRLIGFRFSYWFSDPKRGDIVVFRYPIDEALGKKTNYIKRIIGLPGETIEIKNSKIYINGSETPLEEDYLKEKWTVMNDGFTFEVPEGCYLMLGDNRNDSSDARYWASKAYAQGVASTEEEAMSFSYVKKDKILGKAYFRYWPLTQISSLY
ncbi:MAG: signal peptidase I [Lachnospiraceae bacterium]|nr:signal peptidase I [Lachnospiraceae bacterium]